MSDHLFTYLVNQSVTHLTVGLFCQFRYLFKCKAIDKTDRKMAFELEVCAIPKVDNVVGKYFLIIDQLSNMFCYTSAILPCLKLFLFVGSICLHLFAE